MSFPRARLVALAVGLGALGSLAGAPAAFAAGAGPKPPAVGLNCQQDGKINGGGSTFQTNGVLDALAYGYQQDVCGPQASSSNLNSAYTSAGSDPSIYSFGTGPTTVDSMLAYNVSLSGTSATSGSGNGLLRMSCRTDFFGGTDLPYNTNQLTQDQAAPGTEGACSGVNTAAVPPPFGPATSVGYPNSNDASASMMGFPIAAGADAIAVNLNGMCTNGTPGTLNFTANEFNEIWQGTINQWNDPALVATNPILTTDNCSGNIQRVVRQDNSGTTAILMFTLYGIDLINGNDGADLCGSDNSPQPPAAATEKTWYSIATSSNNSTAWPAYAGTGGTFPTQDCVDVNGNHALPVTHATTSGSPALIALLKTTNGGIGYAETGLWGTMPAGVSFANLQTYADEQTAGNGLTNNSPGSDSNGNAAFIGAGAAGQKSSCTLPASIPTGNTANQAVGLSSPNWSNSGTTSGALVTPGKQDIAWSSEGAGYPACGLTFDLVYAGANNETGEATNPQGSGCVITSGTPNGACETVAGPLQGATNDQLRTLYSYFTYVFSPLGQSAAYLPTQTLDPLPAVWLPTITSGFQNNY